MKLEQTIQQHVEKLPLPLPLPLPLQGEVLDYVLFLEQKPRPHPADDQQRRTKLSSTLEARCPQSLRQDQACRMGA